MEKQHGIYGIYNTCFYEIWETGGEEPIYRAGNSRFDSQGYTKPEDGIGLQCMKEYCISTAEQLATERGLLFLFVEEHHDACMYCGVYM